jgi:hypothetical protein
MIRIILAATVLIASAAASFGGEVLSGKGATQSANEKAMEACIMKQRGHWVQDTSTSGHCTR